jgi:hypothetical protein
VEGIQSAAWDYKDGEQENMTKRPSSEPLQAGKLVKVALFRDNTEEFLSTESVFSFERTVFLCLHCWDEY